MRAAEALGKIGDKAAAPALTIALTDSEPDVCKASAKALAKIGVDEKATPIRQGSQRQRENTERCLTILTRCQTPLEIIDGLGQVGTLLRQVNDPLANAAGRASNTCRTMSDEYVRAERDYFISACKAFLADIG